jgi:probable phosphoglycerate mutase
VIPDAGCASFAPPDYPERMRLLSAPLPLVLLLAACSSPPPGPAQVCVARHAESFGNLTDRSPDLSPEQLDTLTPNGEAQARAAGAKLPGEVVNLWTSPKQRAQQTAASYGLKAKPMINTELRPLDGDMTMATREQAWALGGDPRPEGGESLADGAARAESVLGKARALTDAGQTTVLVTHSDLSALILGALQGTPVMERLMTHRLETAEFACAPL